MARGGAPSGVQRHNLWCGVRGRSAALSTIARSATVPGIEHKNGMLLKVVRRRKHSVQNTMLKSLSFSRLKVIIMYNKARLK